VAKKHEPYILVLGGILYGDESRWTDGRYLRETWLGGVNENKKNFVSDVR